MARGKAMPKRQILPDPKYGNETVAKFMNYLMESGKKTIAQGIVYGAMDLLAEKKNDNGLVLFEKALDSVRPLVEVRSRRVGGANYQVPMPVSTHRANTLAFRWIIDAARARKGKPMMECLAAELIDALDGIGGAMKKKEDTHRMAEANKAFAHFARRR